MSEVPSSVENPSAPTATLAWVSLVFGILAWSALPLVASVIAIVLGHLARGEIARSQGGLRGRGVTAAALVLGYSNLLVTLLLLVLFGAFFLTVFREALAAGHPLPHYGRP